MSLFDDAHSVPDLHRNFVSAVLRWLLQQRTLLRRLTGPWGAWREHSRSMAELRRFTDRELRDLALSRADVMAIDEGRFRRD